MKEKLILEPAPEEINLDQLAKERSYNSKQVEYLNNLVAQIVELKKGKSFSDLEKEALDLKTMQEKKEMIERLRKLKGLLDLFESVLAQKEIWEVNNEFLEKFFESAGKIENTSEEFSTLINGAGQLLHFPQIYRKTCDLIEEFIYNEEDEKEKFHCIVKYTVHKIQISDNEEAQRIFDDFFVDNENNRFFTAYFKALLQVELIKKNKEQKPEFWANTKALAADLFYSGNYWGKFFLQEISFMNYCRGDDEEAENILNIIEDDEISDKVYESAANYFIVHKNYDRASNFIRLAVGERRLKYKTLLIEQLIKEKSPDAERQIGIIFSDINDDKKAELINVRQEVSLVSRVMQFIPNDLAEKFSISEYLDDFIFRAEDLSLFQEESDSFRPSANIHNQIKYLIDCLSISLKIKSKQSNDIFAKIKEKIKSIVNEKVITIRDKAGFQIFKMITDNLLSFGIVDQEINKLWLEKIFSGDSEFNDLKIAYNYFSKIQDNNSQKILKLIENFSFKPPQDKQVDLARFYLSIAVEKIF